MQTTNHSVHADLRRLVPSHERPLPSLCRWQALRVERYIAAHLATGVCMHQLLALTRLSKSHFSRAFKGAFGQTFSSYLIARRIALAQHLMLTTDATLGAIASHAGFADQPHFCRLFRRHVGARPDAWRRAQQATDC